MVSPIAAVVVVHDLGERCDIASLAVHTHLIVDLHGVGSVSHGTANVTIHILGTCLLSWRSGVTSHLLYAARSTSWPGCREIDGIVIDAVVLLIKS